MTCTTWKAECKAGCLVNCQRKDVYRPSNGSEGMWFHEKYCGNCIHDNPDDTKEKYCELITAAMCCYVYEKDYPTEWQHDHKGKAWCTKFVKWDWGNDGDPDDPDNPKRPPDPPDPRQLHLFPLFTPPQIMENQNVISFT